MLAALVIGAGLTGCGSDSDSDSSSGGGTLRVGQLGAAEVNKALLAASGEDQDLDYKLEWQLYPTGPALLEAAGSLDTGQMADTPPIFGQVNNAPIKVVAAGTAFDPSAESYVKILVPKGSDITDASGLKGKKVALSEGTILQYTVVKALEAAGLSYDDITPVALDPADAAAAFQSGDVDAIAALDPQLSLLVAGGARVVADGVGTTSGYNYVVATDKALADKAKTAEVLDFIQRLNRAQEWANDHQDEWAAKYAEITGLDPAVAKAIVSRQKFTAVPIDDDVYAAQQEEADTFHDLGLLPELDVKAEFDDRFNDALVGDQQ